MYGMLVFLSFLSIRVIICKALLRNSLLLDDSIDAFVEKCYFSLHWRD